MISSHMNAYWKWAITGCCGCNDNGASGLLVPMPVLPFANIISTSVEPSFFWFIFPPSSLFLIYKSSS